MPGAQPEPLHLEQLAEQGVGIGQASAPLGGQAVAGFLELLLGEPAGGDLPKLAQDLRRRRLEPGGMAAEADAERAAQHAGVGLDGRLDVRVLRQPGVQALLQHPSEQLAGQSVLVLAADALGADDRAGGRGSGQPHRLGADRRVRPRRLELVVRCLALDPGTEILAGQAPQLGRRRGRRDQQQGAAGSHATAKESDDVVQLDRAHRLRRPTRRVAVGEGGEHQPLPLVAGHLLRLVLDADVLEPNGVAYRPECFGFESGLDHGIGQQPHRGFQHGRWTRHGEPDAVDIDRLVERQGELGQIARRPLDLGALAQDCLQVLAGDVGRAALARRIEDRAAGYQQVRHEPVLVQRYGRDGHVVEQRAVGHLRDGRLGAGGGRRRGRR